MLGNAESVPDKRAQRRKPFTKGPCGRLQGDVPGKKFADPIDLVIGDAGDDVAQISFRIEVVQVSNLVRAVLRAEFYATPLGRRIATRKSPLPYLPESLLSLRDYGMSASPGCARSRAFKWRSCGSTGNLVRPAAASRRPKCGSLQAPYLLTRTAIALRYDCRRHQTE